MSEQNRQRILMVDDEPNVLAGYRRSLRKFDIELVEGGAAALELLSRGEVFSVIVTDMRMPGMDGVAFLSRARKLHRDTSYIMLTGNADQDTCARAINEGQIFRFLTKPCSNEVLEQAILAGQRQYELVTAEHVLTRQTLMGSIKLLSDVLELSNPALAKLQRTLRDTVKQLADGLHLELSWQVDLAASLCLLGFSVLGVQAERRAVTEEELDQCAETGARLLKHIPRLEPVAAMIRRQRETGPLPPVLDLTTPDTRDTIGARLLRFAVDLNQAIAQFPTEMAAVNKLRNGEVRYDERLLQIAEADATRSDAQSATMVQWDTQVLGTRLLTPGMILSDDLFTLDKRLLLTRGHELTAPAIERLRLMALKHQIDDHLSVMVKTTLRVAA